jgi:hypothetical protein
MIAAAAIAATEAFADLCTVSNVTDMPSAIFNTPATGRQLASQICTCNSTLDSMFSDHAYV